MYLKKFYTAISKIIHASKIKNLIILLFFIVSVSADSFNFNSYNNHGVVGLINMPSARFYNESIHGITIYNGSQDQKITLTSNPYEWFEASFFYMNIENRILCRADLENNRFCQGYKDKGFNLKFRILEEGRYPAIAIGINDIAGTGYYSSEYIVSSYGKDNIDFHFGIGWGNMNGSKNPISNPLGYFHDSFKDRSSDFGNFGGDFQPSKYFSGKKASPFYGFSYIFNEKLIFKYEKDVTLTPGKVGFNEPKSKYSYGVNYNINNNFVIGISHERGNYFSFNLIYKNNPQKTSNSYKYKKAEVSPEDNNYTRLIKNLENNGIGVNKIIETSSAIGIELTQFIHPNIDLVEEIIMSSKQDAGIKKDLKKDLKIVDLKAISEIDDITGNKKVIYQKQKLGSINTKNTIKFRPFIASRESFFKGALLAENDTEVIIKDNFLFTSNIKYSLADNFDDLTLPPVDIYPAQVRSDVKEYLRNIDEGVLIGRAQFDYFKTLKRNHHLMTSAGILEDMFLGYGFEYLYFKGNTNYAVGFELFEVKKRDYKWRFGTLDYKNVTGSINFYYRNYGSIPFDMKMSYGEYLAGDVGSTIEFSRSFENGTKFGVFASFTDVTAEQFGEGTFDKGIFFNIPIYGNFINYTWKPLTKDPGAKLNRRNSLHDLLVKFRPIN